MSTWTITPPGGGTAVPLADIGLTMTTASFYSRQADIAMLSAAREIDTEDWYAAEELVTIYRDGARWFSGRVPTTPRSGDAESEILSLQLMGPWADLEQTLYQVVIAGQYVPFATICRDATTGAPIMTGETIRRVILFAAACGCNIQLGTVPNGVQLWPSEATNMMCADVILTAMAMHPDWMTEIDHTTSPPTFHVRPAATAETKQLTIGVDDVESIDIAPNSDQLPTALRLIYKRTDEVNGTQNTIFASDIAPVGANPIGRKTLTAVIDLAGQIAQRQTTRVKTKQLPSSPSTAKAWLKEKFPNLADIPDAHFNVTAWSRTLKDDGADPAPANASKPKLEVSNVNQVPNELISGTLEDWQGVMVAMVHVACEIQPSSSASQESRRKIAENAPRGFSVRCTSSSSRSYSRLTSWTAGETAPVGLAAALWPGFSRVQYIGTVPLIGVDLTTEHYLGKRLNLLGGHAPWATMQALVTGVTHDLRSGSSTLILGPLESLAPQDFFEMLRQIRSAPPVTYGFDGKPDSETVDGYYTPTFELDPSGGGMEDTVGAFFGISQSGENTVLQGGQVICGEESANLDAYIIGEQAVGTKVWVRVNVTGYVADGVLLPGGTLASASYGSGGNVPSSTLPTKDSPSGSYYLQIGEYTDSGFKPSAMGAIVVQVCPGSWIARRS